MSDLKYKTEKWDDTTVVLVPLDEYSHIIETITQMAEVLRNGQWDESGDTYEGQAVREALKLAEPYLDKVVKDD